LKRGRALYKGGTKRTECYIIISKIFWLIQGVGII